MYEQIAGKFRSAMPEFPEDSNLDLGLGIKQIRLRMGMTQSELAKDAGMKPAALKTLENGYAKFTTTKNLEALAQALKMPLREILLELPERDRLLLKAVFLDERDRDEVCEEFGVERDYLRVLLHRAKQEFKTEYVKRIGTEASSGASSRRA